MSLFDFSVLMFFLIVACKALYDSVEFWRAQDELALLAAEEKELRRRAAIRAQYNLQHNKRPSCVTRTRRRSVSVISSVPVGSERTILPNNRSGKPVRRLQRAA